MEDKDLTYLRCPNCGKYFAEDKDKKFCSEECKIYYESCVACGKYFISSREAVNLFCSIDCGTNKESLPGHKEPLQTDLLTTAQESQKITRGLQVNLQKQDQDLLQQPLTPSEDNQ